MQGEIKVIIPSKNEMKYIMGDIHSSDATGHELQSENYVIAICRSHLQKPIRILAYSWPSSSFSISV